MTILQDFREQHPQYSDVDDETLAQSLHAKYYTDTDYGQFRTSVGIVDPVQETPKTPSNRIDSKIRSTSEQMKGLQDDGTSKLDDFATPEPEEPGMFDEAIKGQQIKPWKPSLWERIQSIGASDAHRARGLNEWAARDIAEEEGIPVEEVYSNAGFARPVLNPEGRDPVQSLVEGGVIAASQLKDVPQATVNTVLRVIRGGDDSAGESYLDQAIDYTEPAKIKNTDPNYQNLYGLGKSLGYSLTTMTASALAAAGTVAAGMPAVAPGAAMAAGGGVAYRASKDEFLDRVKEQLDKKSESVNGRPLNPDEWTSALEEYETAAMKYGAWEAIPEAASNLVFLRALSLPLRGASKEALTEAAKRAAQAMASEQATETITGVGQSGAEQEAGLGKQKTVAEAFRDQALQTAIITGLMGGAGAGGRMAVEGGPQKRLGRALTQDVEGAEYAIPAEQMGINELDPENAQLAAIGPDRNFPPLVEPDPFKSTNISKTVPDDFGMDETFLTDEEEATLERKKQASDRANERIARLGKVQDTDELQLAIAKYGGINREHATGEGIDPEHFKEKVYAGVPVSIFPAKEGRSFDEMAEALAQDGYLTSKDIKNELIDKLGESLAGREVYTPTGIESRTDDLFGDQQQQRMTLGIRAPTQAADTLDMGPGTNYAPMIGKHRELPIDVNHEYRLGNGRNVRIPEQPVRRNHIIKRLQRSFGNRIYQGKVKGKSRLGFYRPRVGEIRIRHKNDLEVTAHELAHWIDDRHPWVAKLYKEHDKDMRGVSYDSSKDYEGYAEFMRLWLTQEHEARERAPGFYDAWAKTLADPKNNELAESLYDVQEMMHAWYMQGAKARMASKIGDEALPVRERISMATDGIADRMLQESLDKLHAFKIAELKIEGELQDATISGYKSLRLAMGHSGVTKAVLERGTVGWTSDGNIDFTGSSLKDVFAPVENRMEDVQLYFVARRAQELTDQGRENLFRPDEIRAGLQIGENDQEIAQAFDDWLNFNNRMMDFYQDSGILGEGQRAAIEEMNKNYIPFNRILEAADNLAKGDKGKVIRGGSPFMRLKGGSGNINDVFESIISNTSSMIHMSLINKGKQNFYNMVDGADEQTGAMYAVKVPTEVKPVEIDVDQVKRAVVQGLGLTMRQYNIMKEMPTSEAERMVVQMVETTAEGMGDHITFFQHGMEPKGNIDSVLRDGKKVYYEIGDPLLYDAIASLGPQVHNLAVNILGGFANVLRRGVTMTPTFQAKNFIRDTMNAFTLSKGHIVPVAGASKALLERTYNDEHYWEYMANGGGFATMAQADGINVDRIASDPRSILDKYDEVLGSFELANRISEYKALKKKGYTGREAALMGREISTDFAMRGSNQVLRVLTISIPFLNARMQGHYRIAREVGKRTPEGKFRIDPMQSFNYGLRALTAITIPTLALYALNKDDERYQEMPEYVKDLSWIFFTGDGEDDYFIMPKPFETGMLFGTLPERTFELIEKQDGKEFADAMLWMALETTNIDLIPQAYKPLDDLRRNKKFTGAPIIPEYMEHVEPAEQYRNYTSDAMIALGDKLNISPIKAEYLVRGYFGTLGTWALGLADMLVGDLNQGGERVSTDWEDNVLLSPFVDDGPLRRTKSQQDLYDMLKITRTVVNTVNLMQDRDPEKVADYLEGKEKQLLLNTNKVLERQARKMREISNRIDAVTASQDMTGDEKRKTIQELLRARNELTRETMKGVNQKKIRQLSKQVP